MVWSSDEEFKVAERLLRYDCCKISCKDCMFRAGKNGDSFCLRHYIDIVGIRNYGDGETNDTIKEEANYYIKLLSEPCNNLCNHCGYFKNNRCRRKRIQELVKLWVARHE